MSCWLCSTAHWLDVLPNLSFILSCSIVQIDWDFFCSWCPVMSSCIGGSYYCAHMQSYGNTCGHLCLSYLSCLHWAIRYLPVMFALSYPLSNLEYQADAFFKSSPTHNPYFQNVYVQKSCLEFKGTLVYIHDAGFFFLLWSYYPSLRFGNKRHCRCCHCCCVLWRTGTDLNGSMF